MNTAFLLISLMNLALVGTVVIYVLRAKRWLWAQICQIEASLDDLRSLTVQARKDSILAVVGDSLRLPALMPSQYGEDILLYCFFSGRREGFFVDIGAFDGIGFSNTYFLEALGWDGILVEPVPGFAENCRAKRPHSRVVEAACGQDGERVRFNVVHGGGGVGTLSYMGNDAAHANRIEREGGRVEEIDVALISLGRIMAGETRRIDVLSIDVEGAEIQVLSHAELDRLRPAVIIVEDNSGGADHTVSNFLAAVGYRADRRLEHNVFYVWRDDSRTFVGI